MGYKHTTDSQELRERARAAQAMRRERAGNHSTRVLRPTRASKGESREQASNQDTLSKRQLKRRRQLAARDSARRAEVRELYDRILSLTEVAVSQREYAGDLEQEIFSLKSRIKTLEQSSKVLR